MVGSSAFSCFMDLHTALHSRCTNLHPHPQWNRLPFSPPKYLSLRDFLTMAILTRVKLIPHSSFGFHFSHTKWCWESFHVFFWPPVCLLWRNVYLEPLTIFLDGLLFWYKAEGDVCIFWRLVPGQSLFVQKIFSHSVRCLFIFFFFNAFLCCAKGWT